MTREFLPDSIKWMVKKSLSTKSRPFLVAASYWVVRLQWLNWIFVGGLISLTVFAGHDPERIAWALNRVKTHRIAREAEKFAFSKKQMLNRRSAKSIYLLQI